MNGDGVGGERSDPPGRHRVNSLTNLGSRLLEYFSLHAIQLSSEEEYHKLLRASLLQSQSCRALESDDTTQSTDTAENGLSASSSAPVGEGGAGRRLFTTVSELSCALGVAIQPIRVTLKVFEVLGAVRRYSLHLQSIPM